MRRLRCGSRFHIMQPEYPSAQRRTLHSPEPGRSAVRRSLPASRQSPPRPLDLAARSRPNSPKAPLSASNHQLKDDLDLLRREIALRRQEQEQRNLELKRILPTDFSETLTTEPLHEEQDLPQCTQCLLL